VTGRSEANGPIFIGGLSHSGKTQLRSVLGAHPELSLTRRTYLWDRFYGRFGDLERDRNLDRCLRTLLVDDGVRRLEPDAHALRRAFASGPRTYARLFALLHEQHATRRGRRRWGEQLGFVERFARPIFAEHPDARMIHMIRDPRDGRLDGRPGRTGWETARWLRSAGLAERNASVYGDRYRIVRYEAFAAAPEPTVVEVCGFLGEDVVPPMREALAVLDLDLTRSPAAVEPRVCSFVERHARHELPALGYRLSSGVAPTQRTPFADGWIDRAAMVAWNTIEDRREARWRRC
jgi:hypothetical protein